MTDILDVLRDAREEVDASRAARDASFDTNGHDLDAETSYLEENPFHSAADHPSAPAPEGLEISDGDIPLDEPRVDWTVTLDEFVARKPDVETEPLIACEHGPIAHAGALIIHGGKASAGKTTQVVDLILHAAAGVDYCGLRFPRPLRILVIENEGPREGFRQKLETRLTHGPDVKESIRIWDDAARWGMVKVSDDDIRAELRTAIEMHRIDIVVSDSLTRFGMKGNGTPEETRDFLILLADIGLGRDAAFLILAHTRTRSDNAEDEIEQLAGAWAPHADAILMLKKLDGNRARLSWPKTRWTRGTVPAAILAFDPDTETFTAVATDDDQPDAITDETYEQRVLKWVTEHPWATTEAVDKGVEGREIEVRKARQRLEGSGRLSAAPSASVGHPGRATRWNLSNHAGQNPVPGLGTPRDDDGSQLSPESNSVRGVPPVSKGDSRTGLANSSTRHPMTTATRPSSSGRLSATTSRASHDRPPPAAHPAGQRTAHRDNRRTGYPPKKSLRVRLVANSAP